MGGRICRIDERRGEKGIFVGCDAPGFGYESGGYDPFFTLSFSIHLRAAATSSADAV